MNHVTPTQLTTINLKYSSNAEPLKMIAFADLTANALFLLNKESDLSEITTEITRILSISNIDEKFVSDALQALKNDKKVTWHKGKWKLSTGLYSDIKDEKEKGENALESVLKNHFPTSIEKEILKKWFLQATADFFGFNGGEWVKAISKDSNVKFSKPQSVNQLLTSSIGAAGLSEHKFELENSFNAFLASDDCDDQTFIMNLGFAMFSAKLVTADIGADSISISEIQGGTFLLDTNVLLAIHLDGHKLLKAIQVLGAALKKIGVDLILLNSTKDEYNRVFVSANTDIDLLFKRFSPQVVLGADSKFVESAVMRGCTTKEHFDVFLENVRLPPNELPGGLGINMLDNPDVEQEVKKASTDNTLKTSIQKHSMKLRFSSDKKPKTETALQHDAALIRVVEKLRRNKAKTWVLSLDRGLQVCAAERVGVNNIPSVLMLEGLIQILALNNSGPGQTAADFAPLLTSIILNRCTPSKKSYSLADLRWLHSVEERAGDFSSEHVKKIVNVVTQHRFAGGKLDDAKLRLEVNRAYQDVKREHSQELEDAKERAKNATTEVVTVKSELLQKTKDLSVYQHEDCLRAAKKKLRKALYWRIPVTLIMSTGIYLLAKFSTPQDINGVLEWFSSIVGLVGISYVFLKHPIEKFRKLSNVCSTEHFHQ